MSQTVTIFALVYGALRLAVFGAAALAAGAATLAWLVRTRRVNAFSPVARFVRGSVDPLIAPVERRVVRAGGLPHTAPWWMLVAVVVGGIVLLNLVQFLGGQLIAASFAASRGVVGILGLLLHWVFAILQIALIVRVISSWVGGSPYSKWFRWSFVLTEPILAPLRRIVPTFGMIDLTPIVAYFLLRITESLLLRGF